MTTYLASFPHLRFVILALFPSFILEVLFFLYVGRLASRHLERVGLARGAPTLD